MRGLLLLVILLSSSAAGAAPMSPEDVPAPLQPWIGWVLHGHEQARCPVLFNAPAGDAGVARECVWGHTLELRVGDGSARFRQAVRVLAPAWVGLPGGAAAWPETARVDGAPVTVADHGGRPAVRLEPGAHVIEGEIRWPRLPPHLQLPPQAGLLDLELRGERVPFPDRDAANQVWFGRLDAPAEPAPERAVQVDVFRRLIDEVPFQVVTRIELRVAGAARELLLGRALLDGYIPIALRSKLPARLEADGRVRLQARAGRWTVTLVARGRGPVSELTLPALASGPWAEQEVWVFDARNALRVVKLQGLAQVDPNQTRLPEAWKQLPAYVARPGDTLEIETQRRGNPEPEPDQLSLSRTLWLDFDGGGYTFSDRIEGAVTRSWRLDALPVLSLGRVVVNGQAQFITREDGREGVEIRQGQLQLEAEGRIAGGLEVPAAGWRQDFHRTGATLNLPPGWRLVTAAGADGVSPSWLGRWTLFDLFLVLIIAAVVGRLWGWAWALVALIGLALAWHEPGAPRQAWLHALGAAALLRVLPAGRFRTATRVYQAVALAGLVILAVPFTVNQVRVALFPQLEHPFQRQPAAIAGGRAAPAALDEAVRARPATVPAEAPARKAILPSLASSGAERDEPQGPALALVDPKANVQTGPGLPRWQWQQVALSWSGPVQGEERVRLVLISPGQTLALRLLAVLLVGALVARLLHRRPGRARPAGAAACGLAPLLAGVLLSGLAAPDARAELPGPRLLERLRERLLEAPECLPRCAQSPRLVLESDTRTLRMSWFVHALEETAVPLPGSREQWLPQEILVDDAPAPGVTLRGEGELWLLLAPGRHVIRLSGPLPARERVALPLALAPHRVEARLEGWALRGVKPDGAPDGPLQLEREPAEQGEPGAGLKPSALPPFVRVERTLRLGLEWRVATEVRRVSPKGAAVALAVPLLPGEAVTTEGVGVDAGKVQVTLAPDASAFRWESVLEPASPIALVAPDDVGWTEVWRLEASPIWHVRLDGIPVVHQQASGRWLPEWRPWPGEQVRIRVTRPAGVAGPTLTLEASQLALAPGSRATEATLALTLRSSQGTRHPVTLPEGAELQSVSLNGRAEPIRPEGRVLVLPLSPGSHDARIVWRSPSGTGTVYRSPEVALGAPSVNAAVQITVPPDRWVLYAGGPALGPAVLFWGLLAVLLAIAAGLARTRRTPLGVVQWMLLSVGLSQVPVWLALGVVGWLFALDARGRIADPAAVKKWQFNLMQVALALVTAGALAILFYAVQQGLLGRPDMQIGGNGSSASLLSWFEDRIGPELPIAWVLSVPMWVYRALMLAWALWLAFALVGWVRWGFGCFAQGGIWRAIVLRRPRAAEDSSGASQSA